MADGPGDFLIKGLSVIVSFKNKSYQGIITEKNQGNVFIVRLIKPDQTVLTVMLDSKCPVQCISDEGLAYKFECSLVQKKIPYVSFKYLPTELSGVNVRKHPRIPVSYWASILERSAEAGEGEFKEAGDGTIADMSEGGCKLMTSCKYHVNDPIFLSFEPQEGKAPIRFKGKIRQIRIAPHDLIYYGIQFDETFPEFFKTIKSIIENPQL